MGKPGRPEAPEKREGKKYIRRAVRGEGGVFMAGMKWYKVWLVVPGRTGCGKRPCEPEWWNDMEQAPDEETAVRQANEKPGGRGRAEPV